MSEDANLPLSYRAKIHVNIDGYIVIRLAEENQVSDEAKVFYGAVSKYIEYFNKECDTIEGHFNQTCEVIINFHRPTALIENAQHVYNFCHTDIQNSNISPIIHITVSDLLNIAKDNIDYGGEMRFTKRYASIMDSSIWNYYAPIKKIPKDGSNNYDFIGLRNAVKNIIKNHFYFLLRDGNVYNLYDLAVTHEYANLSTRLLQQSYLDSATAHGALVSPFLFHSEQKMTLNSKVIAEKNRVVKRRILFLDDHCNKSMSHYLINGHTRISKKDIITARLEEVANLYEQKLDDLFELNCIDHLNELSILEEKKFDIILVDYLLSENVNNEREYGYQILEKIKNSTIGNYKGPIGKYWIMFTSAFIYAVQERLLAEGYSHSDDNWYIGRTACPISTPELFKYNLLSLMKRQIDYITEINGEKGFVSESNDERDVVTLVDFLIFLFKEPENVRAKTLKHFNSLLRLRARYDLLKKDYYMGGKENPEALKNGSPLVQSLFPDLKYYSNAFWEHIQHLIYLIAFGNIRQWNEMWDEYIFIKDVLWEAEGKQAGEDNIVRKIEKYIIEIKNANYR